MPKYCVIDTETTGLNPYRNDRIVEIAAVLIADDGMILDEFVTVLNPERDVGPTNIHGLTAADVQNAPRFSEVATPLIKVLRPAVALAGHNVRFDISFLWCEFERIGVALPHCETIDTLLLAGGGSLSACCCANGVNYGGTKHSALDDARATAKLLVKLLSKEPKRTNFLDSLPPVGLPEIVLPTRGLVRRDEARESQRHAPSYIAKLVSCLPPISLSLRQKDGSVEYNHMLGRALEDRVITEMEGAALIEVATRWGLGIDQITAIHWDYMRRLAKAACADGVVTSNEQQELLMVARLLGFKEMGQQQLESLINDAATGETSSNNAPECENDALRGKTVCFTGEGTCRLNGKIISRDMASEIAMRSGLEVVNSVTKKLDILVVADPHTQSSKARKARQYGLRIIHEPEFWRQLGIATQ